MAETDVLTPLPTENVEAEPSVTLETAQPEAVEPSPQENRARELGWVPQEEWKGPAERWKPAADFLSFHESRTPALKQENIRLQTRLDEMRAQLERLERAEAEREIAAKQLKIDGLKYERKQALDNNDNERLTQIDDELIAARANEAVAKVTQAKTAQQQQQEQAMAIWRDFLADGNEWANNEEMAQLLITETAIVKQGNPQLQPRAVLERAKDRVQRLYPERFDRRTRAPQPSGMVDMGGLNGAARGNTRSWNDLQPDAKAMFEKIIDNDPVLRKDPKAAMAGILKNCASDPQQYFRR